MQRRKFLKGVGAAAVVALAPLPAAPAQSWGLAPGNITATEVIARQTLFQKRFADEFLHQYESMKALNRMMDDEFFKAVYPIMEQANNDLAIYGTSTVKISSIDNL